MYFRCPFNEKFLSVAIEESGNKELKRAYEFFSKDNPAAGHEKLKQLMGFPNFPSLALVLSSLFSKIDESEDEFVARHILQLEEAAYVGDPFALYALGVYCDQEGVDDFAKEAASIYFKRSAEKCMPQAMYVYGVMLYYGTGGAMQDRSAGLNMINFAADSGVVEAREFLAGFV